MTMRWDVSTKREMNAFAREVARSLHGGEVLALEGTLGAGKTYFTQQLAKALDVKTAVTSPTFVLMNIYPIANKKSTIHQLVHLDCYRLDDPQELIHIGITDWIGRPDTVVVIEWADKAREVLKSFNKSTHLIKFLVSGSKRTVVM